MTTTLITLLVGIVLGALVCGLVIKAKAPGMMLMEDRSTLGFEETVSAIEEKALAAGWKVPSIHRISETIAGAGFDVRPVAVIELCSAPIAGRVLGDDKGRRVAPMMPCRVAVYENADGSVTISRMNSTAMSRLFGGVIEEAMSEAAAENEDIIIPLLATD